MQISSISSLCCSQYAIVRSIECSSTASSLRTGKVTWIRAAWLMTRSCSVVSQQDLDHALRLVRNQHDGVLGVAKRKRGIEDAARRDRAGRKVARHHLLQVLGVERGRAAHRIVPCES